VPSSVARLLQLRRARDAYCDVRAVRENNHRKILDRAAAAAAAAARTITNADAAWLQRKYF